VPAMKSCTERAVRMRENCRCQGDGPCIPCAQAAIRQAVKDVIEWNREHFLEIEARERALGDHARADAYHNAAYHLQVNGDSVCPS
jgi:hypothetical protein